MRKCHLCLHAFTLNLSCKKKHTIALLIKLSGSIYYSAVSLKRKCLVQENGRHSSPTEQLVTSPANLLALRTHMPISRDSAISWQSQGQSCDPAEATLLSTKVSQRWLCSCSEHNRPRHAIESYSSLKLPVSFGRVFLSFFEKDRYNQW